MDADQILAGLLGHGEPTKPTSDGRAEWRGYLCHLQTEAMKGDQALTPKAAMARILPLVRGEFLAAFPGREEQAKEYFTPAAA